MKIEGIVGLELESRFITHFNPAERYTTQEQVNGIRLDFANGDQVWLSISKDADVEIVRASLNQKT
jgi:hypothetical protein